MNTGEGISKLGHFPALVSLFVSKTSYDHLLRAVLEVEQCAVYLDVPQSTWLLHALFKGVCDGTAGSGAAYARVVARKRRLDVVEPGLGSMDAQLIASFLRSGRTSLGALLSQSLEKILCHSLKSIEAVQEYISAISACGECASFTGVYAIARALTKFVNEPTYTVVKLDRALAAVAERCEDVPARDEDTLNKLVELGLTALPETMAALVRKLVQGDKSYLQPEKDKKGQHIIADDIMALHEAGKVPSFFHVARFMVPACAHLEATNLFGDATLVGFREEFEKLRKAYVDRAYVAELFVLLSALIEGEPGSLPLGDLTSVLKDIGTQDMLTLWKQHQLVRDALLLDADLLRSFLDGNESDFDQVICVRTQSSDRSWEQALLAWLSEALQAKKCDELSIAIERAPVSSVKSFAGVIQSAVRDRTPSIPMVRYCAVLGRVAGRCNAHGAESERAAFLPVLKQAWEVAPSAVLDAAEYWGETGSELFDLLVAGARRGRYEEISKMTNRFGDWNPARESLMGDPHEQIVGAFFGFCDRAKYDGGVVVNPMRSRLFCSESGSNYDAMVSFSFWEPPKIVARQGHTLHERGFSRIHGILLAVANGAAWPSPSEAHQAAASAVDDSAPIEVARAVRLTPYLVTFVDPKKVPFLMALVTVVPECAAFLDQAQRTAVKGDADYAGSLDEAVKVVGFMLGAKAAEWPNPHELRAQINAIVLGLQLSQKEARVTHSATGRPTAGPGELGNVDVRRMLSVAYMEHIRGTQAIAERAVVDLLRLLGDETKLLAGSLINEYNTLIQSRDSGSAGWTLPMTNAADTPRFGRRRLFV
jgi:hypothetical protein